MGSITSVEGYRQSHVNFGLEFGKVVSPNSKQKGCPRNEDVKVRYKNHPTGATNDQRRWLCMKDFKYQSVQGHPKDSASEPTGMRNALKERSASSRWKDIGNRM